MAKLTAEQLAECMGCKPSTAEPWVEPMHNAMACFEISTPLRQAHFLAQVGEESDGFRVLVENMNFTTAERLYKVYPKDFKDVEEARPYVGQPERIANRVYLGNNGNGDEASGDGWRFRGRGLIQITGRGNYSQCAKAVGVDFVKSPELLAEPHYACMASAWFWYSRGLNKFADADDVKSVTLRVNGGFSGLEPRTRRLENAKKILMA